MNLRKIKAHFRKIRLKQKAKLQQERNQYIKRLNHDIKTPILAHIQTLELLKKGVFGKINSPQKEILTDIIKSHYFILQVIVNTIFILNYENEEYKPNKEKIDIVEHIQDCINSIKNYAKDKEQEIIFNAPSSLEILADKKIVQKIIYNILQSSIESGLEKSEIEISLRENKKQIFFSAKNRSVYMSKEKVNSLFDEKSDTLKDFNQLGMSLNLNIAKKLIKAQNWNIIAKSKKDNSATFGFIVDK